VARRHLSALGIPKYRGYIETSKGFGPFKRRPKNTLHWESVHFFLLLFNFFLTISCFTCFLTEQRGDGVTKENCICGIPNAKKETFASILSNTEMMPKNSKLKPLSEVGNTEVLDTALEDELQGEILSLQNNLPENARAKHSYSS